MHRILIKNKTRPSTAPITAVYCDSFFGRFRGLMFRSLLAKHEGLLLVEGHESRINTAIHMLFMRFDITAVWINSNHKVVDVKLARRWKLSYIPAKPARYTLETLPEYFADFKVGDQLIFTE
jgi:uncharacterized membrane protein (UPF0127 family)